MGTPAVNLESAAYTDCYLHSYSAYSGVDSYSYSKAMTGYVRENRPASVSTVPTASGWRNPTAWSHYVMHTTPQPPIDFWNKRDNGLSYSYYGDGQGWSQVVAVVPDIPSDWESRAITKALAALKNQHVNLAVAFGERAETADLVANAAKKIAKQVRNFKHRRPKDWLRVLRRGNRPQGHKVPDSWLELQYGWNPLMQDVFGACDSLNSKERDGDAYRATVKGRIRSVTKTLYRRAPGTSGYCGIVISSSLQQSVLVRLDYVLENPLLATLSQLGITNPGELVWELVPYSFVVDWFLPVGGYLSSMDAALGWSFKGGSCSRMSRLEEQGVSSYSGQLSSVNIWEVVGSPSSFRTKGINFKRTVYTASPLPRFPGLKNPLSTGHVANAMSLLVSAFR